MPNQINDLGATIGNKGCDAMPDVELVNLVLNPQAFWNRAPGCDAGILARFRAEVRVDLPDDYFQFLEISNGGDGDLGVCPFGFRLWPAESVLEHNARYQRDGFYADLFLIGSSGGGSCIAFNIQGSERPVIAMDWYDGRRECIDRLAPTFRDFVRLLGAVEAEDPPPTEPEEWWT